MDDASPGTSLGWDGPSEATTAALLAGPRPRFSEEEMARRRAALVAEAARAGTDLVLLYGAQRFGSAVPWLTGWGVTREAALVVDAASGEDVLFVQFHNHVPLATQLASGCEVRWGGPSTTAELLEAVRRRSGWRRRLGVVGPVGYRLHAALADAVLETVDLGPAYVRLRTVKSPEELDWLTAGAHLSDLAALALRDGLAPGLLDHELADLVERAYVPRGGTTHIHYFGITSMSCPDRAVPAQVTTGRRVEAGDVVVTELSAALGGYAGQILRTITMADRLEPPFDELHAVAVEAFDAVCAAIRPGASPADVVAAADVIEGSGFTTVDDLVHGFGGGYLPPVIGSRSRPAGPLPELLFEPGMTVVVQPNVTTTDGRAGVQTGELVVVTDDGVRSLHAAPRGAWLGAGVGGAGAGAWT